MPWYVEPTILTAPLSDQRRRKVLILCDTRAHLLASPRNAHSRHLILRCLIRNDTRMLHHSLCVVGIASVKHHLRHSMIEMYVPHSRGISIVDEHLRIVLDGSSHWPAMPELCVPTTYEHRELADSARVPNQGAHFQILRRLDCL